MKTCDVLVVGLGPAGGAAALAAASSGLRVMALERRRRVGSPVQCAEYVPSTLGAVVRRTGAEVQRVVAMRTLLPSGDAEESRFPGIMIDRARLDAGLAQAAREAGAELALGCRLVELDGVASTARCLGAQGERRVSYRVLIAADGPFSPVAAALALPPLETVLARQVTVPLLAARDWTEVYLSADYPGGYAWLFPKGKTANLGAGVKRGATPLLGERVRALHRRLVREGAVGEEVLFRSGGAIPVGGLRPRLVSGNVLFAGDAAGLTHPVTGAGIHPAVVSGEMAGRAAAAWLSGQAGALADYERELRELFGAALDRAVRQRKQADGKEADEAALRRAWVAFGDYYQRDEVTV